MFEVDKDEGVMLFEGNVFAFPKVGSEPALPYVELVDGEWVEPVDDCDTWEARSLSWDEFETLR